MDMLNKFKRALKFATVNMFIASLFLLVASLIIYANSIVFTNVLAYTVACIVSMIFLTLLCVGLMIENGR